MGITARSVFDTLRKTLLAKRPQSRRKIDQEKKDRKTVSGSVKKRHRRDRYISILLPLPHALINS